MENQEPIEDRSQDGTNPQLGPSVYQPRHSIDSDPDEAPLMGTRLQEEISARPHMGTGVQEDFPNSSLETSSGKHKKARSTGQPQFRS